MDSLNPYKDDTKRNLEGLYLNFKEIAQNYHKGFITEDDMTKALLQELEFRYNEIFNK